MALPEVFHILVFYDNSISSGAKMKASKPAFGCVFYDNSISSGAKISNTPR